MPFFTLIYVFNFVWDNLMAQSLFYTRLCDYQWYLMTGQPSHNGGTQESWDCGEHVGYSHQSPCITEIRTSKLVFSFLGTVLLSPIKQSWNDLFCCHFKAEKNFSYIEYWDITLSISCSKWIKKINYLLGKLENIFCLNNVWWYLNNNTY